MRPFKSFLLLNTTHNFRIQIHWNWDYNLKHTLTDWVLMWPKYILLNAHKQQLKSSKIANIDKQTVSEPAKQLTNQPTILPICITGSCHSLWKPIRWPKYEGTKEKSKYKPYCPYRQLLSASAFNTSKFWVTGRLMHALHALYSRCACVKI